MHEVTETYEIDGWHHVIPSKGKNKGKTLAKFKTEREANEWARLRSKNYKPPKGLLEKEKKGSLRS